jgi:hypothetical protein
VAGTYEKGDVEEDAAGNEQAAARWTAGSDEGEADQIVESGAGGNEDDLEESEAGAEEIVEDEDDSESPCEGSGVSPVNEEYEGDEEEVRGAAGLHRHIVAARA